jgi:hypothetical protein
MAGMFNQPAGLGQFLSARDAIRASDQADLAAQQNQELRQALSQSGGDLVQSLSALLKSGNIKGANELAPLIKLQQEKQFRDQTAEGLRALYSPQASPQAAQDSSQPVQLSGPGSDQATPETPTVNPTVNPVDAKRQRLQQISQLYPQNAALQTAVQKEMDRLDAESKPIIQMIPIGNNQEQPHISRDNGKSFQPIEGSKPRDIFSPSQNQIALTPAQSQNAAVMRATGMPAIQVMPGYGRNMGQARLQMNEDAINYIARNQGLTHDQAAEELANRDINYAGGKKSVGQLTMMQGATRAALSQLDFNVGKVSEVIKSMPGSDLSPVLNAIIRQEQKWTGDPKYSGLFYYMNAAAQESARILSNGQASIAQLHTGAAEEARKWADANWTTPKAWLEGVAPAMHAEAENRLQNFSDAIKAQRSPAIVPSSPTTPVNKAPQAALDYLKAHPETGPQFKAKYGYTP